MFRQVPVLPVVVPLALLVLAALLWRLHRRRRLTVPRAVVAAAACVYLAGVVANTVFPVYLDKPGRARWGVYLAPFDGYEVADAVMNVLVFVPLGVLVSLLLVRPAWWRVVLVTGGLSLAIETSQLLTGRLLGGGHVADVNDLLFNVVGGALGATGLDVACRVPAIAALVERFRWR